MLATGVVLLFRHFQNTDAVACAAAMIVAIALPHMLQHAPRILMRLKAGNQFSLRRLGIKLLGLLALYSVVLLAYLVFRGFTDEFLRPLLSIPGSWLIGLALLVPVYIAITDRVMTAPEDALYALGCNVLGTAAVETNEPLRQFLLGWLVKSFFGPLMIVFLTNALDSVLRQDIATTFSTPGGWYDFTYSTLFFIDVAFAATGYLCTLKLFEAHIRSAEPTLVGWLVCIICYPPFWNSLWESFFNYDSGLGWGNWLGAYPILYGLWGSAILVLIGIFAWSTMSFGMRFSNLTHRGILTNGPYRYSKHPAYVAKNMSWWLVTVPFIPTDGGWQSILNCLALLMVNGIYTARALTEERHLSRDATYVAYAAWIAEHGLFASLRRRLRIPLARHKSS